MLSYLIVGVIGLLAGGAITAVYYRQLMAKYGQVATVAEAVRKTL